MKIAIVTENYLTGGLESQILTYTFFFQKKGIEFFIISSSSKYLAMQYEQTNFQVIKGLSSLDKKIATTITKIENILDEKKIDHVIIHPFVTFRTATEAAINLNVPYSLVFHGPTSVNSNCYPKSYYKYLYNISIPNAQNVFCVSKEVQAELEKFSGFKGSKYLPNPYQFDIKRRPRKKKITIASRIDKDKIQSLENALDIISKVPELRGYEIVIYGSGDSEKELKKTFTSKNINGSIMGYQNNSEIVTSISESIFVIGMGRVALEGFASDTPVLISGYDGIKGFVTNKNYSNFGFSNFSGRRMETKSSEDIVSEIIHVLKDSSSYKLKNLLRSEYDINIVGERLLYSL